MSPEINVERPNCIRGWWLIEFPDGNVKKATTAEMIEYYISKEEGREVELSSLSEINMTFTPANPEEIGGHGVNGVVHIEYKFKESSEQT